MCENTKGVIDAVLVYSVSGLLIVLFAALVMGIVWNMYQLSKS